MNKNKIEIYFFASWRCSVSFFFLNRANLITLWGKSIIIKFEFKTILVSLCQTQCIPMWLLVSCPTRQKILNSFYLVWYWHQLDELELLAFSQQFWHHGEVVSGHQTVLAESPQKVVHIHCKLIVRQICVWINCSKFVTFFSKTVSKKDTGCIIIYVLR